MNNEPAFPVPSYVNADGETHDVSFQGMTLRDYFAAKAMQGILYVVVEPAETAKHAYAMADAMLKAREA